MRWLVLAPSTLAAVLLSLWLVTYPWSMTFPTSAQPFVSHAWRDESKVKEGVRLGMADQLIADGTLLGKARAEVVDLLGEPPPTGYFADWDLVYWLGPERGYISIDSEWLVLRLSAEGRVIDNRIVRD
jgi:hypothetical protein